MFLILLLAEPAPRRQRRETEWPMLKVMRSLAGLAVPAHGFVVGSRGLTSSGHTMGDQVWDFFKQLIKGCAVASAIAAGLLIYTAFVQKWKDRGYPTIPISALVAAEQVMSRDRAIPLGGSGSATRTSTSTSSSTRTTQTSLLDLDEYQG